MASHAHLWTFILLTNSASFNLATSETILENMKREPIQGPIEEDLEQLSTFTEESEAEAALPTTQDTSRDALFNNNISGLPDDSDLEKDTSIMEESEGEIGLSTTEDASQDNNNIPGLPDDSDTLMPLFDSKKNQGSISREKFRLRPGERLGRLNVHSSKGETEMFEGDMVLNKEQKAMAAASVLQDNNAARSRPAALNRNAIRGKKYLWPENTLRYQLSDTISIKHKDLIRTTLVNLQSKLSDCIKFVEASSGNRIVVQNDNSGSACWSSVGYQDKPNQALNLKSDGCMYTRIIEHEFLHALGIQHEQSRSDRNSYIEIVWANIQPGKEGNFERYDNSFINHYGLPYNFKSVMHYGKKDASKNGQITIKTLDSSKQNVIGQQQGVSEGDIQLLRKHYNCKRPSPSLLKAVSAKMSSTYSGDFPAERCIDGRKDGSRTGSMCHTRGEKAPWLALDFGLPISVEKIVINNREDCCGDRFRNVEVWVADQLPNSGHQKFTGGHLLASFKGPAKNGDAITLPSGTKFAGRFVIVQIDNGQRTGYLNLNEVTVWGKKGQNPWHSNGRCGSQNPLTDGRPGQCDPKGNKNEVGPCCSNIGWCGNSDAHCKCQGCKDFRTNSGTNWVRLSSYPRGRVELYKNGQWGTLCGHFWWDNQKGAENICKALGYGGGTKYTAPGGSGPILAGNRLCEGGEATVWGCPLKRAETTGCSHDIDQGVSCT